MTPGVAVLVLVCGLLDLWVMAAPTVGRSQAFLAINPANIEVQDAVSGDTKLPTPHLSDIKSVLPSEHAEASHSAVTNGISEERQYPYSFSYTTPEIFDALLEPTKTVTVIAEEPIAITLAENPTTVTEIVTFTPSPVPSSSSSVDPLTTARNNVPGPAKSTWEAPKDLKDLSSFQVVKYSGGESNIRVVTGIPAEASARPVPSPSPSRINQSPLPWDNSSWALRLFYPQGSIDPGHKPQGGAQFYAVPIDISDAQSVTLQYSVFFPADFDWVLAGKLPGLYGGHEGCSGGNAATDCFSTRLMWRPDGAGELYLYAPKEKQTEALCSDPGSVCDPTYGLSVGRGLFDWQPGAWTTVQQTVGLNTPGKQDGTFLLDVNGHRKIERHDVFYRGDISSRDDADKARKKAKTTRAPTKTTSKKHHKPTSSSSDDGGILGPLLGGILGLRRRESEAMTAVYTVHQTDAALLPAPTASIPEPTAAVINADPDDSVSIESEKMVKFVGIFFSTFFGGHEDKYATPRDQYVWFKDFALAYNS